jgi:hypothetical protein
MEIPTEFGAVAYETDRITEEQPAREASLTTVVP